MRFAFDNDQLLLRDALGEIAERHWKSDHLAAFWGGDFQVEEQLHQALAEAGVLGMSLPEAAGGIGQGLVDLCCSLEEAGRHALPDWVAGHLLSAPLLAAYDEPLEAMAQGACVVGLRLGDQPLAHAERLGLVLNFEGDRLEALSGLHLEALESVDRGRPLYRLTGASERRLLAAGEAVDSLRSAAFNRVILGDCLQLLGLAQNALDRAVAYAAERHQFGKPVGAQQAVKHHLANALIGLEFARPMVQRAVYATQHQEAETDGRVSGAWLLTGDAVRQVERAALQVHGAMGYSFEYPLHHVLKRCWALRRAHGPASVHRQRAASWILEN